MIREATWVLGVGTAVALGLVFSITAGCREAGVVTREPQAAASGADARPPTWSAPASSQRPGDPRRGRRALLEENYIGCGVPETLVDRFAALSATPGLARSEQNRDLPFYLTRYRTDDGVSVVTANCLGCHAGFINGELVIGLGNTFVDFSINPTSALTMIAPFVRGPAGREFDQLRSRIDALYPSILTKTRGPNPADHIAAVLFAHRDPKTLAWSDEPLMALPSHSPTPVDVPAWWLMSKKNAMFYTAAGRGDHARIMMTASALCTDSVEQARVIDAYFPDIRAYIASLDAPASPLAVAPENAARGKGVFAARCARCHGTYSADPTAETYPNLVVDLDIIGTDPTLAVGTGQFASRFVEWFNSSFYGQIATLEPQRGYVAPPLDGIWATAPYFHNGSVPTLAGVLDSSTRPKLWRRTSYSSSAYDTERVGWRFESIESVKPEASSENRGIYDTREPGYSAAGHTFGDGLSERERTDLLEYLKTL